MRWYLPLVHQPPLAFPMNLSLEETKAPPTLLPFQKAFSVRPWWKKDGIFQFTLERLSQEHRKACVMHHSCPQFCFLSSFSPAAYGGPLLLSNTRLSGYFPQLIFNKWQLLYHTASAENPLILLIRDLELY